MVSVSVRGWCTQEEGFRRKFDLSPSRYRDVLALAGKKAAGVTGVPGLSKLRARQLVQRFGGAMQVRRSAGRDESACHTGGAVHGGLEQGGTRIDTLLQILIVVPFNTPSVLFAAVVLSATATDCILVHAQRQA